MASPTVENYLKAIYLAQQGSPGERVAMGAVAADLAVTPGTVTTMVKALAESNLVDYEPRAGVRLTRAGRRLALQVLRRHRLIELFLVEVLHLDWAEVHDEAEELEHAISDKVLERIDALLGHPETDPHGDPIPSADGRARDRRLTPLHDCPPQATGTISRVTDQDPGFLQFVDEHALTPGTPIRVTETNPAADAVTVQPLHQADAPSVTLGQAAASKLLIETR